ncbi:IclR family transcriptional regulator [Cryptosporangium aurantiacum]|uniref:Transcriptional regulator, IclR family n=1 Tax=Cryptosporangium aurantiacum TaxID=134849 RepID=A0A1M7TVD8_9ACTN|nr:IclR family transcriptional regulator [Cryptosporangium aurantiacum]SHN74675.1 transcriptional regulator, IclR family [Cryptosporangium aurantiacum]
MSQSVARALSLLDRVANGTGTLGELAEAEGVHKSTVLRLLRVLEEEGFVHHDGAHRYVLGPHLFRLAQQALDSFEVRVVAAPRLRRLRDEISQTVHLAVLDGAVATYVDKLEPREMPVRMASRIGASAALHSTAVGKVLLAGLDPAERDELVARLEYERFTERTPSGPAELLAEVARVAERGWATDHAENETFINCVAAPIRGADGRTLAAVSVSVPDVLLPYEGVLELVPSLVAAAADASRDCGHRP